MNSLPPAPREIEPAVATALREALTRAGFDPSIFRTTGPMGDAGWKAVVRAACATIAASGKSACATLIRLFLVGDPVRADELAAALGPGGPGSGAMPGAEIVAGLERAGICGRDEFGAVVARCILLPARSVWALSDLMDDPADENSPDEYILPVGESTTFVDELAVREPCELAVDLGCGQGYHAIRSLSHARRCIATDINPRAVEFARANAALMGAGGSGGDGGSSRIECRVGSFFEPLQDVAGRVGLLTCNPPYIMNPAVRVTALVNSFEGDGMMEHLVRTTPMMLTEGGWGTLIGLWEHVELEKPTTRVESWLRGLGCDALVLQFRSYLPEDYYQQWISPSVRAKGEAAWRHQCAERGIGGVTFGAIILKKRAGTNWVRTLQAMIKLRTGGASRQFVGYFRTQTALDAAEHAGTLDQFLLETAWSQAPGWRFDPLQPLPRAVPPLAATMPAELRGLPFPLHYAAAYESIVPFFDGRQAGRAVLSQLSREGRISVRADDPQAVAIIRTLAQAGAIECPA